MIQNNAVIRRIQFTLYGIIVMMISLVPDCQAQQHNMSRDEVIERMKSKPAWLREKPLVQAKGNHEPLIYIRRRGHAQSHFRIQQQESGKGYKTPKESWLDMFSDETIKRQQEYGNTFWLSHLHNGFGLEVEREDREYVKSLVPKLHEHGF